MKNVLILILLCAALLTACGSGTIPAEPTAAPAPQMQIGNPWRGYDTMQEAEAACGFTFPLPEVVAGSYVAESFRVMNHELMEVVYRDGEFEITVRMQSGEDLDLSGVYAEFESTQSTETDGVKITVKCFENSRLHLITKDGYSYCLYAPNDYRADTEDAFLSYFR